MSEKIKEEGMLLDYIHLLVKWRYFIVTSVVLAGTLTLVIASFLPRMYTARATLLPPSTTSSPFSGLSSFVDNSSIPFLGAALPEISNNSELFIEILESRTLAELIINRFDLMRVYDAEDMEETIEVLKHTRSVRIENAGVIIINIDAPSPELAAEIVNAYIDELDRFNRDENTTAAKSTRIFIESRLLEAQADLQKALNHLQEFQEKNQLVSLDDQARTAVEAAARIESQLRIIEVELGVKQSILSKTHPEIIQIHVQAQELRLQLDNLKRGGLGQDKSYEGSNSLNIPFIHVPALQNQLGQRLMDVKIQSSIVETLLQQYEQAKIQEVKDTPTVKRLDSAVPPARHSKPRRSLMVLVASMLGGFSSLVIAFCIEFGKNLFKDSSSAAKMDQILGEIGWLRRFLHR